MKKDVSVFLTHIIESIEAIEGYTKNTDKNNFIRDKKLQDAVMRRLEIIGEAVKNLPSDFTSKHKEVEWTKIARMRDKLIHNYFGVDIELTYAVVKNNLPDLKEKIKKIIAGMKQ